MIKKDDIVKDKHFHTNYWVSEILSAIKDNRLDFAHFSVTRNDGTQYASDQEFEKELQNVRDSGVKFIKDGKCNNFSPNDGCLGHDYWEVNYHQFDTEAEAIAYQKEYRLKHKKTVSTALSYEMVDLIKQKAEPNGWSISDYLINLINEDFTHKRSFQIWKWEITIKQKTD